MDHNSSVDVLKSAYCWAVQIQFKMEHCPYPHDGVIDDAMIIQEDIERYAHKTEKTDLIDYLSKAKQKIKGVYTNDVHDS